MSQPPFEAFLRSLAANAPPPDAEPLIRALWHAGRSEWEAAHEIVQVLVGKDAAWVHAHLHRLEGDHDNAGYWYRRAGRAPSDLSVREEWEVIARTVLRST